MNHRLKDKAATLSAMSLQGDNDEGVGGQAEPSLVPNGCPKTPSPGVLQHTIQWSRTGIHEFKATHKQNSASPGYSLRENNINQNICTFLSNTGLFFFLILSSHVKNDTGFAGVETSFS